MNVTLPIFETRQSGTLWWTTLGLGPYTASQRGRSAARVRKKLLEGLRQVAESLDPAELRWFQLSRGVKLKRLRLELSLQPSSGRKRKVTGLFPLLLEPRKLNSSQRVWLAYHPWRQDEWFPLESDQDRDLEQRATRYLQGAWAELELPALEQLKSTGKERLRTLSFSCKPRSVLDQLHDDEKKQARRAGGEPRPKGRQLLDALGLDQTARAAEGDLPGGQPRSPYRQRLQQLLTGSRLQPTLVVGPPRVGKSTLLRQWICDLLEADGYPAHRNLDRVRHVWQISGQRVIAGMTYLGDWEQRCLDLLRAASPGKVVLLVDDLPAFPSLGRTRNSERCLADFFRGPLARGDLVLVGECTPEQLQRLEQEAPAFAGLLARVHVLPTDADQTLGLMLHEVRRLERGHEAIFDPLLLSPALDLAGALFPGTAQPGTALELVRGLARLRDDSSEERPLGLPDLVQVLSSRTGLPPDLLLPDEPLDPERVRRHFAGQIMGQPEAVEAARDLVLRIRSGLTAPGRPLAVYLMSGPTGTGKTELARCIAAYLFGNVDRLLRFDMGEYSGPEAAARLVGDRLQPRGALTEPIRQQPFCVLLLDEIDKAHPAVLNLLLQLLDEGRLTDAAGNTADFTHAVVLMTSNLGARPRPPIGFGEEAPDAARQEVSRAVREFFPPELFNRIDQVLAFRSLTPQAAQQIAAKELAALQRRAGLTERRIFVQPTRAVLDRVVQQGFDPVYGARTVQRYLDQQVGAVLAESISASPPAAMRTLHLYSDPQGQLRLHAEALTEAEIETDALPLEPLLDQPVAELQKLLPATLDFLDQLQQGGDLERLVDRIRFHLQQHNLGQAGHAEQMYNLESLRQRLSQLRGRVGYLHARRTAERRQVLRCLAEVMFLQRALQSVERPEQHAVFVELMPLGQAGERTPLESGLLPELLWAYLGRDAELEGWAILDREGLEQRTAKPGQTLELPLALVEGLAVEQVVLKLVGLNVLDLLAGETGCHVWRSLSRGTEVLRVRVLPAPGERSAAELSAELKQQTRAFEQALERGDASLPQNPRQLLPLVREYRFDPPARPGASAPLELTDYGLGHATTLHARRLADGLEPLWLLRMSLQGPLPWARGDR